MKNLLHAALWFLATLVFSTLPARADIRLPKIFSDHMVIQRDTSFSIWGWADAKQELTITIGDELKTVVADNEGNWRTSFPAPPAGGPYEIRISGAEAQVVLNDVLVGDVWICAGEVNMELPVAQSEGFEEILADADLPDIRLFSINHLATDKPAADFVRAETWTACSPSTVENFSAIGFLFASGLHKNLSDEQSSIPIGMIQATWSGSPVEAWIPHDALTDDESLAPLLEYWKDNEDPSNQSRPGSIYNGMVAPLVPFSFRGVIWYQGESNVGRGSQYGRLLPKLIGGWRDRFENGDFPFYFVQLTPHRYQQLNPAHLPEIWNAQRLATGLPNTGLVTTSDVHGSDELISRDKREIAGRIVNWALGNSYGKRDVAYQAPMFHSIDIRGQQAVIQFDHVGDGLSSNDGKPLTEFTISGKDGKFLPADAVIDGQTVAVSSEKVPQPVAVRFSWTDTSRPNLVNSDGVPAVPFRTDRFPLLSAGRDF